MLLSQQGKCGRWRWFAYAPSHTPRPHPVLELSVGDSEGRDLALQLLSWQLRALQKPSLGAPLTREARSQGRQQGQPRNARNFPSGAWPASPGAWRAALQRELPWAQPSGSCDWWAPWRDQVPREGVRCKPPRTQCPPLPPPSSLLPSSSSPLRAQPAPSTPHAPRPGGVSQFIKT